MQRFSITDRPSGVLLRRCGFTLVEVLAGLTLLGTLLAALLVADAAQSRQAARAADRLAAVSALDRLLEDWTADAAAIPPAPAGPLTGDGRLLWTARRLRRPGATRLGCVVVRIEARLAAAEPEALPIASVEVLVADEIGLRR